MFDPEVIQGRLRNRLPAQPTDFVSPPQGVLPNPGIPQPRGGRPTPTNVSMPATSSRTPANWSTLTRAERRAVAQGPTRRNPGAGTPAAPSGPVPGPAAPSPSAGPVGGFVPFGPSGSDPIDPGYGPSGGVPSGPGMDSGGWGAPQADTYNPMTDPWSLWAQAVPVMNLNRDQQIGDAMATAGFSGNRYGTWAGGKAAEIGAENSLSQDALLGQLLSSFANNQEDRALQGTRLGLDSAALQDQMTQSRLMLPFQMGQYEQNRQDQFANTAFQDWSQNRLGWLGPLINAANQQGAGSPGQIYTTQTPGSPGVANYLPILAALFGGH